MRDRKIPRNVRGTFPLSYSLKLSGIYVSLSDGLGSACSAARLCGTVKRIGVVHHTPPKVFFNGAVKVGVHHFIKMVQANI